MATDLEIQQIISEEFKSKIIALESLKQPNSPFKMLSSLAVCGFEKLRADSIFIEPNIKAYFLRKILKSVTGLCWTNRSVERELAGDGGRESSAKHSTGMHLDSKVPAFSTFIMWSFRGAAWSIWKYLQYAINIENIFELKIFDVAVGDQVVSSHVRFSRKYPSKFQKDLRLIITLLDSYLTVRYAMYLVKVENVSIFMLSHNCYRYALFNRVGLHSGKSYLALGKFPYSIYALGNRESAIYPSILPIDTFQNLSDKELNSAKEYMAKRTTPGTNLLEYMDTDPYAEGEINLPIGHKENTCNVCIFLHSFADALFMNGPDTFSDLWEWTITTIDSLCAETDQKINVLIKPHPNVFLQHKIGSNVVTKDLNTYDILVEYCQRYSNVFCLPASVSNHQLTGLPGFVGVTHHGNVATELAYLGLPVIASAHAPWKHENEFVITWSNKGEYVDILGRISDYVHHNPSRASLFKFAYYYYIKFPGGFGVPSFLYGIYKSVYGDTEVSHIEACGSADEITAMFLSDFDALENSLPQFFQYLERAVRNNLCIVDAEEDYRK
jgi:hypothetical protein